ncbi:MAG TPA: prepilin-type N-terminal cleavage/methylation domain-containing protein [Actinomycetota bacterium]|nr:prepilin-type N-terminal cleavage/methylation domain-containing protein [Actinomycetota bacterium]
MTTTNRREHGLTLIETLMAITIFSIMTLGIVPLLGTAMSGGAATRTESVARNVTAKTMERLRGLDYHVAYSSVAREVDLLDHFFPGRTPSFVPSVGTGFDAATSSYVTTCDSTSTSKACRALPDGSELPDGVLVEVRATFRTPENPSVTAPVPLAYSWNSTGNDGPPSDLLEVEVTTVWSVGASARSFDLTTYLGARGESAAPSSGGGGGSPPPTSGPPPPPTTVKLRSEARIDYGYEVTTTYQDTQSPPRMSDYTGTLGTAVAYGEQLESGSKAELSVSAGRLQIVRPANPAVSGDQGFHVDVSGATLDARAPADATTTTVTTAPAVSATTTEVPATIGSLAASEAGTLTGARGAGPTVANGLPFVRGYYDINGTTAMSPMTSAPNHFWTTPQTPNAGSGTETSINPLGLYPTSGATHKMITVSDWQFSSPSANVDPRGEVMVDSTPTTPASSRTVTATATIPAHGQIVLFPMWYSSTNNGYMQIREFSASVSCAANADPGTASQASGSWSAHLSYNSYEGTRKQDFGVRLRQVTLPVQTRTDNPHVPYGDTNPLQTIRDLNNGNGPKIYDADQNPGDTSLDAFMFAANGKRGLLTGWSQGTVQTSISADDRVVSAQLNGAIRFETAPVYGPWGASQRPNSDTTFAMGKLSCKAEDYR